MNTAYSHKDIWKNRLIIGMWLILNLQGGNCHVVNFVLILLPTGNFNIYNITVHNCNSFEILSKQLTIIILYLLSYTGTWLD